MVPEGMPGRSMSITLLEDIHKKEEQVWTRREGGREGGRGGGERKLGRYAVFLSCVCAGGRVDKKVGWKVD